MKSIPCSSRLSYSVPGTRLTWADLQGWLNCVFDLNRKFRPSEASFRRAGKLYRCLSIDLIRACDDEVFLEYFAALLRESRYADAPLRYGLGRVLKRPELGELIVETENHIRWIKSGKPIKIKGPTLDPRLLPDERLDILIQSHKDMNVVQKLRNEKERRLKSLLL